MVSTQEAWNDAHGAQRAITLFRDTFSAKPEGVWVAPGRVNLIGEHVDYNGGLCLPMALPHRTFVAARRRSDDEARLVSALDPQAVWSGGVGAIAPGTVAGWVAYAAGPAWTLRGDGHPVSGFEATYDSCVPLGAGLSSSAAIECATAAALDGLFGFGLMDDDAGRAAVARACQRAENEVAGAPTGGLDQAAAMRCRAGHALELDCLDGSVQQIPFDLEPDGLRLLVIDTRAEHALVDGQYAARRASCEEAARILGVQFLREVTDLDAALAQLTNPVQQRRVRHVVTEIARVRELVALLRDGRIREAGAVMDASHTSLRDDYEVTCPELDVAVEAARDAGALGARMTGGGFGGSAIALVPQDRVERVMASVADAFAGSGFQTPEFLVATAAGAADRVR